MMTMSSRSPILRMRVKGQIGKKHRIDMSSTGANALRFVGEWKCLELRAARARPTCQVSATGRGVTDKAKRRHVPEPGSYNQHCMQPARIKACEWHKDIGEDAGKRAAEATNSCRYGSVCSSLAPRGCTGPFPTSLSSTTIASIYVSCTTPKQPNLPRPSCSEAPTACIPTV